MRLRFLCAVVVALLGGAGPADAGIFKKPGGLPKPVSLVSERTEPSAVATQTPIVKHPPRQYSDPEWGSRFDQIKYNYPPRPLPPYLMRSER